MTRKQRRHLPERTIRELAEGQDLIAGRMTIEEGSMSRVQDRESSNARSEKRRDERVKKGGR